MRQLPIVRARLAGDLAGLFTLDTGFSGTIDLHPDFIQLHHLLEGRSLQEVLVDTPRGRFHEFEGNIAWFELGGHRFQNPIAGFGLPAMDPVTGETLGADGIIGREFLRQFMVVFNYSQRKIAFVANK